MASSRREDRPFSDLPLPIKIIVMFLVSPIVAPIYVYFMEPLLHLIKHDPSEPWLHFLHFHGESWLMTTYMAFMIDGSHITTSSHRQSQLQLRRGSPPPARSGFTRPGRGHRTTATSSRRAPTRLSSSWYLTLAWTRLSPGTSPRAASGMRH